MADPGEQRATELQPDDQSAVLAANEAFYAAFNDKSLEAMDAVWAQRDDVTCVHPGWNPLEGREAVMDSWRSILGNAQQPKVVSAAHRATVWGDAAIVAGRELVAGSPIATTNAFVREGDGWKMVLHHASPVLQGA